MNHQKFDTVVVGSGTSAYYAVDALNRAGQKVAIVDERPYGGTCALRGCQPKKYLVSNAEAVAMASHLVGRGIVAAPKTDWQSLQILKNAFLDGRSEAEVKNWQQAGVTTFHGRAIMTGEDEVTVDRDRLKTQHIVLATGATPRRSDIRGAEYLFDSEHFLNLPDLPNRIVFIGGGYISFEFAHVAIRAGAETVTILHRSSRPLKAFDQDIVKTENDYEEFLELLNKHNVRYCVIVAFALAFHSRPRYTKNMEFFNLIFILHRANSGTLNPQYMKITVGKIKQIFMKNLTKFLLTYINTLRALKAVDSHYSVMKLA